MISELKEQTALLVIDVQQDFCGPRGLMAQYGVDMSSIDPAVDQMERLIAEAHHHNVAVVFISLITHASTDSHVMKTWYERQGLDGDVSVAICRRDSFGAEDYRLSPGPCDYAVSKQRYSGFVGTNLELLLQQLQIKRLVVSGVTTECCVDSTVRDAFMKDYEVFVVGDACAAYEQDVHEMSLKILAMNFATILSTEEVIASWNGA